MKKKKTTSSNRKGQAMIMASLAIGGTLLMVTGIAGLVMLHQIRESTSLLDSAKALYAADVGIEWGIYQYFGLEGERGGLGPFPLDGKDPPTPMPNGAQFVTRCLDIAGAIVNTTTSQPFPLLPTAPFTPCDATSTLLIRSIGRYSGARRSFEISIFSL